MNAQSAVKDELYETAAYSLIYGADYILLNRFLLGGRGLKNERYLLTVDETNRSLEIVEEVLSKAGKRGHVGTELPYCLVRNHDKYKQLQMSFMCGDTLAIDLCFVVSRSKCMPVHEEVLCN